MTLVAIFNFLGEIDETSWWISGENGTIRNTGLLHQTNHKCQYAAAHQRGKIRN